MIEFRDYQASAIQSARDTMARGVKRVLLNAATGAGKCLGKGTPVLMLDGSIKPVEDILPGDQLMGPDSLPRNVLTICSGKEPMYRVVPVKGTSYVVNESHILSLKRTHQPNSKKYRTRDRGGEIRNISVREYIDSSKTFKHLHKAWRTGVDFKASADPLLFDPYFLGLWLGDGDRKGAGITTGDHEVMEYLGGYAKSLGLELRIEDNSENSVVAHLTTGSRGGQSASRGNPIVNALDRHGLRQRKHVPMAYKTASRENRLKLLAGYIDADGSLSRSGFDAISISEDLIDDIIFVARSVGLAAYKASARKTCGNNGKEGNYWRCSISGDCSIIPCLIQRKRAAERRQKKDHLVTGIKSLDPLGVGDYFGFEIDGDRLFMLGDFTVTHNTVIAAGIVQRAVAKGKRVLFLAHRRELIEQCCNKLMDGGVINFGVIMAGNRMLNASAPVQVASIQTLLRRELPAADLIIVDECHRANSRSYLSVLANYPGAAVLGLSATPERLDGKGLDDIFDHLIVVETIPGLIERGYLVKPTCYVGPTGDLSGVKTRRGDYDETQLADVMDQPALTGNIVANWLRLARGRRTVVFAASVAHADHLTAEFFRAGVPAATVSGDTPIAEREAIISDWRRGTIQVVSNVFVFTEGFDMPELECCVLARPTQSVSLYLQAVGRIMRPAPGKDGALVIDHAGCCQSHGQPHIHREWSLEGMAKRRKKDADTQPVCDACGMVYEPSPKLFLAELQPTLRSAFDKKAQGILSGAVSGRGMDACPGCGTARCLVCADTFVPKLARRDIDGIAWEAHASCPSCLASYCDDVPHLVAEPKDPNIPDTTNDLLVEMGDETPIKVVVLNEYKRLINEAKAKGRKRGWAYWRLREHYDEKTLRDCLPRHTGGWWKESA